MTMKQEVKHSNTLGLQPLLRGAGQVMFQGNWATGLLFLIGIFWGAWSEGQIQVGWGALVGLLVSTLTGYILGLPKEEGEVGLWGFNGILVGCGVMTFLHPTPAAWVLLILGSAMTVWVRDGMNRMMAPWQINSFTMPFVLTTWLLLAAARGLHALPIDGLPTPSFPSEAIPSHIDLHPLSLLTGWLRGIGQVFLIDSWLTGLLFVIGLWFSSSWAALWAMIGSAVAMLIAILFEGSGISLHEGLYGFSAVLTAIALGCTFHKPSWRSALWSLVGIVMTLFIQVAVNELLAPVGIPSLTFPFCLTTWLFLLPRLAIDSKQQPDHSQWHKRAKS